MPCSRTAPGGGVGLAGVEVDAIGAALARELDRCLQQSPADAAAAQRRNDVELLQVGFQAAAPDAGPDAQQGDPLRPLSRQEDGGFVSLDKRTDGSRQLLDPRRRFGELGVEVLQEPSNISSVPCPSLPNLYLWLLHDRSFPARRSPRRLRLGGAASASGADR